MQRDKPAAGREEGLEGGRRQGPTSPSWMLRQGMKRGCHRRPPGVRGLPRPPERGVTPVSRQGQFSRRHPGQARAGGSTQVSKTPWCWAPPCALGTVFSIPDSLHPNPWNVQLFGRDGHLFVPLSEKPFCHLQRFLEGGLGRHVLSRLTIPSQTQFTDEKTKAGKGGTCWGHNGGE